MKQSKAKGEIIEVEGGRIVRSLGRKDRHSKVLTSKGPKDRRVRLSVDTAMRFYDVQDRLGYDRPSKAIDWLMNEAKIAIDALNHGHQDHDFLTNILDLSEAFHRTPDVRNQQTSTDHYQISSFNNYTMGLDDSRNKSWENPIEELSQMGVTWNTSYSSGGGFEFVHDREPLQSSSPTIVETFNDEFVGDDPFLGFDFQQENQLEEEENCKLASKQCRSSGKWILRYEDQHRS